MDTYRHDFAFTILLFICLAFIVFLAVSDYGRISDLSIEITSVEETVFSVVGKRTIIIGYPDKEYTVAGHNHNIQVGKTYRFLIKSFWTHYEILDKEIIAS